jgi:glutathione peroxidase
MSVYDYNVKTIDGDNIKLEDFKDKVLVIVNTASKCGFTPQYTELQALYEKYSSKDFEILGFPCNQFGEQEPGTNSEVKNFCSLNFGVTFPLFEKVDVRGESAIPLYQYLTSQKPFKGFNLNHPIGNGLVEFLKANFPQYLEGDSIKWNFTKFLVDKNGNVVDRFEPTTEPREIEKEIEGLL